MHSSLGRFSRPAVSSRAASVSCRASAVKSVSLPVKSIDGSDKGTEELTLKVAEESARGLVHRYLVMVQQNARRGTASSLTRSEVRGGGRKPYAQKGTGNARRGSTTSPLFPGGGRSFGPKPKDWKIKMNKKERRLALATAINSAAADVVVVDTPLSSQLADKKTKTLLSLLQKLGADSMEKKTLLVTREISQEVTLAGRNIAKLAINTATAISVFDVLNADRIVIEKEALAYINGMYGDDEEEEEVAAESS